MIDLTGKLKNSLIFTKSGRKLAVEKEFSHTRFQKTVLNYSLKIINP
jgi:hypothetical protein